MVLLPVGAETTREHLPFIVDFGSLRIDELAVAKMFPIESIRAIGRQRAPIANRPRVVPTRKAVHKRHSWTLRLARVLRYDMDNAIDGVGTPQRRPRSAHNFNTLDILEHHIQGFPKHTGKERRINVSPIDQDQQLVGKAIGKTARRNGPLIAVDTRYLHTGYKAQCLGQARGPGAANLITCEHKSSSRRLEELNLRARSQRDFDIHKLF